MDEAKLVSSEHTRQPPTGRVGTNANSDVPSIPLSPRMNDWCIEQPGIGHPRGLSVCSHSTHGDLSVQQALVDFASQEMHS